MLGDLPIQANEVRVLKRRDRVVARLESPWYWHEVPGLRRSRIFIDPDTKTRPAPVGAT
jgi:hypothetical protein